MNRKRRNSRRTPRTLTFRGELGADWDDDWDVLDSVSSIIAESDERRPVVDVVAPIRHMVGSAWRVHVQAWGADRERIRRGQQYLADGAVDELLVERGRIKAIVKGTRKYTVQIVVGMPTATAAEPLLERLRGTSGERTIAALADALRAEGDTLLHDTVRRMVVVCTCPDGSGCKHSVAVVHGFAAYLDRDPALLLTLWGLDDAIATSSEFTVAPLAADREPLTDDLTALFGIDLITPTPARRPDPEPAPEPASTQGAPSRPPSQRTEVERGYLRVLGIPTRILDVWLREGLLRPLGRPDVYARTDELNRRIAEYLAR